MSDSQMDANKLFLLVKENVFSASSTAKYLGITKAGLSYAVTKGKLRCTADRLFIKPDLDEYKSNVKPGRPSGKTKTT